jgi:glycosyltransferase involved in cell wall biosynthesis
MTFHLVTGEYPPNSGGVGHYTAQLASALRERGADVHVWCPAIDESAGGTGNHLHALPDVFAAKSEAALDDALTRSGGRLLLQYVPNALGRRGANLPFCRWMGRMRRRGHDVRVMFHEPYFYFTLQHPLRNALAIAQRAMAVALLRASPVAYLSTETWVRYLRPLAPAGVRFVPLPIPSTLPRTADAGVAARWRARAGAADGLIGHFGTYGRDIATELEPALIAVMTREPRAHALLAGRNSGDFALALALRHATLASRVHATGALDGADAAGALAACDVLLQPYPDGVTTRRTSVMAGLALGVATVTTAGELTEPVWRESQGAVLAPAGKPAALCDAVSALLRDGPARRAQAARGRQAYDERFAIEHAVAALLAPDPAVVPAARVS